MAQAKPDTPTSPLPAERKKEGLLIRKGEIIEKIPQDQIAQRLKQEIMEFQPEK